MRRLIGLALIVLSLTLAAGIRSFAEEGKHLTGTKTAVVTGIKDNTLEVKGKGGRFGSFPVSDPKILEGIKVGDYVKIHFEEGKVTSVEKLGDQMPASRHRQEMPTATPTPGTD